MKIPAREPLRISHPLAEFVMDVCLGTLFTIYTYVYITEKGFWQLIEEKHPDEELFSSAKSLILQPCRYF
jgi:hypothetical protein